jgi:hypothetical protein
MCRYFQGVIKGQVTYLKAYFTRLVVFDSVEHIMRILTGIWKTEQAVKCIMFMQQGVHTQWSNKLWVNILACL